MTLDQWRELRGPAYVAALLDAPWYARANDLIGGWCVMPAPVPPSSGLPEAADFCSAPVAAHIAEAHNLIRELRGQRVDPEMLRWCAWPGCFCAYHAATGPTLNGWTRSSSPDVVLCPPHSEAGHRPQLVPAERGNPVAGIIPTCSCGTTDEPASLNLGELRAWWERHVEGIPS
jgi:hypothetical protein